MIELDSETKTRAAAFTFAEEVLRNGLGFDFAICAFKLAWVEVHKEQLHYAEKDSQRRIEP